jgi:hypothetical protein
VGLSSGLFRVLSLGGYVAFDLRRAGTGLGAMLLVGVVAHVYLLATQEVQPWYFVVYAVAVIACCVLAAALMGYGRNPHMAQAGW